MFWRRARKADDGAARSGALPDDEDDLTKMQRQFGIKTVSDKDVEADFLKLLGGSGKTSGTSGLGLSPRTELALFGAGGPHGDSDDEEAQILRQLNLSGDLDSIDADALSGGDDDEEEEDDAETKVAKRELRGVLGDVHREAKRNAMRNDPLAVSATPPVMSLQERIHAMKLQAVALKREGNVQEALAVFREVKVLEAQLPGEETHAVTTTTTNVAVVATTAARANGTSSVVSHNQQTVTTKTVSYADADTDEQDVDVTDADMENPEFLAQLAGMGMPVSKPIAPPVVETVESLEKAIRETKERAVQCKRSDRIAEALAEMRKIKDLETKLAELQASETSAPAAAAAASPVMSPVEVITPLPEAAPDSDVEVTEDDMNDPAFAAELAKMGFDPADMSDEDEEDAEDDDKKGQVEPPLPVTVQPPPVATPHKVHRYTKRYSSVNDDDLIDAFEDEDEDDPEEDAEDPDEKASTPEEKHEEQTPPPITEEEKEEEEESKASPVHAQASSVSFVEHAQEEPVEVREPSHGSSIDDLMVQLDKTKLLAVQHKRQGNIQAALDMMRRMKQIENLIEMKRRQAPVIPVVPMVSPEELERKRQFGELEALLVQFANDATREAKDQLSVNRAKAAEWLARRKEYSALLVVLREKRTIQGQSPPPYRVEQSSEQVEVEHTDVALDEVHLRIDAIHDLSQAQGKEVFVKFNLSFPSTAPHEGKTGVVRIASVSPFNSQVTSENVFRVKLQRGRGTQRLFEIKKAAFEVWRPGSFMRNPELVARGYQELAPLLTTSEVRTRVLFVGSNRKPVGGDVEITLRVRTPLRDKEYKTLVAEVLRIGEYPPVQTPVSIQEPVSRPVAHSEPPPPAPPPLQARPHSQSEAASPVDEPTTGLLPHTQSAPALQATNAIDPGVLEDPHDLDLIVSYDVINDEIQRIEAALPNLQGEQAAEYSDRLDALGLKKQLLEIDMQTGKLTLDMYVAKLKQRILDDRVMIKQLMKRGRKPDAARVLQRVKIMENELQGAEGQDDEQAEQGDAAAGAAD